MSSLRDHAATARWRLANGRVRASNAWHRAAGRHIQASRTGLSNWRNRRTIQRGRTPRWERVTAEVKSRAPVYRNRINPAHGNPHKADARLHRTANEGLRRMKETYGPARAREQVRVDRIKASSRAREGQYREAARVARRHLKGRSR